MTNSLSNLIDTCFKIKVFLKVSSYELHQYEDGSYAYFKVRQITDLGTLLRIAVSHQVTLFADGDNITIAIYESI